MGPKSRWQHTMSVERIRAQVGQSFTICVFQRGIRDSSRRRSEFEVAVGEAVLSLLSTQLNAGLTKAKHCMPAHQPSDLHAEIIACE